MIDNSSEFCEVRNVCRDLLGGASLGVLFLFAPTAHAQQSVINLPPINVTASGASTARGGYATRANYHRATASMGPLGIRPILKTPQSVTIIPQDLLVNTQVRTVNDALSYLPSVEIRDQQGYEVSRPQALGFQSSIAQNTRLDGLNIVGTTAIPTENLSGIEVLNGLGGALYGPSSPSGVFNYMLAQPTQQPLVRIIEGFQSSGIFTEQGDFAGTTADGKIGYRLNVVQGNGESYAPGSNIDRTLGSVLFDFHPTDNTTIETYYSHYATDATGLPGSVVYDGASTGSGKNTILPPAMNPAKSGLAQPGAGPDLVTDTGLVKITHQINQNWSFEAGGLYQNAVRNLYGITNTFTNNSGDYTVTKNFTAVSDFKIGSNEAYLNGRVSLFGMENDLSFGTNGFLLGEYSPRNASFAYELGTASLADPVLVPVAQSLTAGQTGGQYESAALSEQSIIAADEMHLNDQWAVQAVLNTSFLSSKSWSSTGKQTSANTVNGALSPTVSVIYTPTPVLTAYATWAQAIEQSDEAPSTAANANAYLAPYHDTEVEIGAKYALTPSLLLTVDGFRMTRPYANTLADNVFQVIGEQRNYGIETFAQGDVTPALSVFGGVTYIDAQLMNTGVASTDDKLVVGVPHVKTDIAVDYHPALLDGFALTGAVHYEGARAATNTNNSFAPAYTTLDLGARYTTTFLKHHMTARFQVLNVTDTFYYVSIADGTIVGSPGANTAYLGAPRTFLASLEFDY
ncbi:MAG TPA: TonB-dependent receptor [Acidocella sp.]|uniref:TonB-dependent receptor n=1 Tax=Acidocella sp. TaxID=50710 RepID=UPI002CF2B382|nr:TonB-dependent receptor [Acidocella sp.]HVE20930.1 TonB-dependent receptor [Acidocella sp.]